MQNEASWRLTVVAVVAVVAAAATLAGARPAQGDTLRWSGTILAVDSAAGTIVVGEVGPWQVKDGKTVVTPRTLHFSPATEFFDVERQADGGPKGWPGGFVERPIEPARVAVGDFVTVKGERKGASWIASKVWRVRMEAS